MEVRPSIILLKGVGICRVRLILGWLCRCGQRCWGFGFRLRV